MLKDSTRFWLAILAAYSVTVVAAATPERHVVVVVWDGMRPDFVSEKNTPTLWQLAQGGVFFRNHHSVYPSATIVNGTAMVTGNYPSHDGILANHVYRADIDGRKSIDVENAEAVRRGDDVSVGKYVAVPTISELLHGRGDQTAIATAKTVGLLFDRHEDSRIYAATSAIAVSNAVICMRCIRVPQQMRWLRGPEIERNRVQLAAESSATDQGNSK